MFLYIALFSLLVKNVFSANILFIGPMQSTSHHIWREVLIKGLLEKEHNITLLGYEETKIKSNNYTIYNFPAIMDDYDDDVFDNANSFQTLSIFWQFVLPFSENHLKSDALQTILKYPRDKFDLIVIDLICGQEFYPLIEYFGNPPVVGISPFGLPPYILDALGSHFNYYFPMYHLAYTDSMTFFQRVENSLLYVWDYYLKWQAMSEIYKMAQARYGEDITPFDQMEKKIGVLLANYDPILDFPQPLPPNIISVGGMHVKRSEKLPNDLQEILDKANDGIIFFAFGTVVQPKKLPMETKKALLNVFSKLKQTVLWKYPGDDLENVPKNVVIRKWFSQNDILAHRNTKLFITHSGGLSSQEVMYHGIPVVAIPFFADQIVIAGKMIARGLGKQLDIKNLTEDVLYETILEVINNPIYKQNMQVISRTYRDQKEIPLERAIFWVEYALRNKDMGHLSIKARDMTLFQRDNLDVYGFILISCIATLFLFLAVIKCTINRFIIKRKRKVKQN